MNDEKRKKGERWYCEDCDRTAYDESNTVKQSQTHKHMWLSILIREHDTWSEREQQRNRMEKCMKEKRKTERSQSQFNISAFTLELNSIGSNWISPATGRQTDRQTEQQRETNTKKTKIKTIFTSCNNKNKNLCIYSNISVYEKKKQKTTAATATTTMTAMTIRKKQTHTHTHIPHRILWWIECVCGMCVLLLGIHYIVSTQQRYHWTIFIKTIRNKQAAIDDDYDGNNDDDRKIIRRSTKKTVQK